MMERIFALLSCLLFLPALALAHAGAAISASPERVVQGEVALATIVGVNSQDIRKFTFGGKVAPLFLYKGEPRAFLPADLSLRPQTYKLVAYLSDGEKVERDFLVAPRSAVAAPFGIPEKMGGNTRVAQNKLVGDMNKENAALARVVSASEAYWSKPFILPLARNVISDVFGYSRKTGAYTIPHRGIDFRAAVGTPVFAVNEGVVRLARDFPIYGTLVVLDHGSGVMSLYLHLSDIQVKEGERVRRGQQIGLSGESGYTLEPHLHFSIRINGYSIDPLKFFVLIS